MIMVLWFGPIPTIPTLILCFLYRRVSFVLVHGPLGIHWSTFLIFSTLKVQDISKLQLASLMYQFHYQIRPLDIFGDDFFNVQLDTPSHKYDTKTKTKQNKNKKKQKQKQKHTNKQTKIKTKTKQNKNKNPLQKLSSAPVTVPMIFNAIP